ncbi:MAG: fibronectin type III domain-containing protein, partial [archaeon]
MVIWRDGLFKNGFFSILIALTIIFSIGFVLSVHLISPTSITVNQSQNYVYNITVNNTNVCPVGGNITQLNMTLPGGFVFITDTNGTSTVGGFVNTSSVLSWTNTTYYLINCSTNNTAFWFNATANSTAGSYNITVTSVNASAIYSTNVSITVNDITPPSSITFISQTPATSSNLSSSSIAVNLTANDDVGIGTFRIYLWNSTGVNNTNISSSGTTGYAYINFTGLADGVYYLNTTVNDSSGNENRTSETRRITLDTRAPVITSVVGSGGVNSTSARITWDTNESANSIVYYGTSTGTGSSKSGDGSYGTFQTVYLTGLSASTLYYYNASSCDFAGNCNISIQANFTTSAT